MGSRAWLRPAKVAAWNEGMERIHGYRQRTALPSAAAIRWCEHGRCACRRERRHCASRASSSSSARSANNVSNYPVAGISQSSRVHADLSHSSDCFRLYAISIPTD